jgi:hypothetical protein
LVRPGFVAQAVERGPLLEVADQVDLERRVLAGRRDRGLEGAVEPGRLPVGGDFIEQREGGRFAVAAGEFAGARWI